MSDNQSQNEATPLLESSTRTEDTVREGWTSRSRTPPVIKQWLASFGPLSGVISSGMTSGFSAVLLPQLQSPDSEIPVTDIEASWITTVIPLSLALGCSISGYFSDCIGRRRTHQMLSLIIIIGWALQAWANKSSVLIVGRLFAGFGVGIGTPLVCIYLAEISSPKARGPILASVAVCVALGILISHILGIVLYWRFAAALAIIFPTALLLGATLSPDSPAWLIAQDREIEAEMAFKWLRGTDEQARAEFELMQKRHKNWNDYLRGAQAAAGCKVWYGEMQLFLVMCFFFIVQQWSGINAIIFYSVSLLGAAVTGDGVLTTFVIDIVRILASIFACQLTWQCGRRVLTAISGIGAGLALLVLGVLLIFEITIAPLLIFLLIMYMILISLGLMPVPWIMIGEVFPFRRRGVISGIAASFCHIIIFSVVMTQPDMLSKLGAGGCFLIYGLIAFLGTLIVLIWLPETRNRTLVEIEDEITSSIHQPAGIENYHQNEFSNVT